MSIVKFPLSNGGVTFVDDNIADSIRGMNVYRNDSRGYVKIRVHGKSQYLHRFILNAPEGLLVDHINGDKSDNTMSNVRLCTISENNLNQRSPTKASSHYRLVYKNRRKWILRSSLNKKRTHHGLFQSRHVAGIFADQILVNIVGPFVKRNFPEKINTSSLMDFLNRTSGRIFRVVFSRRSDGRQREMTCRTGVHTRQAGGTILFDPNSWGLFSVYDVQKKAYRFIPLENVICIRYAKTNYRIVA